MDSLGDTKTISICLYADGAQPEAALRLLDKFRSHSGLESSWELLVATNCPRYDLREYISEEHKASRRIIWVESSFQRHQAALWRTLMANSTSRWILLINDSLTLDSAWSEKLDTYLRDNAHLDVTALGCEALTEDHRDLSARGFLVRTSWLRERLQAPSLAAESRCLSPGESTALGLGKFDSGRLISLTSLFDETAKASEDAAPRLSVCLCTYGDHPELTLRCLDSILRENAPSSDIELLIGCNDVSRDVMSQLERRALHAPYSIFIRSPRNLNKSGMQRLTFRLARAPLLLSVDDDIYFLPGWLHAMRDFLDSAPSFDVAGRLHTLTNRGWWSGKKRPYQQFVERKRWWRNKTPHGLEVHFPAGQCFIARRDFLLKHDYPDCGMKIDWDDVLLGDLVTQVDGKQVAFSDELTKKLIVDEVASRGEHGGG